MKNKERYSDREWEELASLLSGEKGEQSGLLGQFMAEDRNETVTKWKELSKMNDEKEINVDKAWNNVFSRMNESGYLTENVRGRVSFVKSSFMRIAAISLVVLSLGFAAAYLINPGIFSKNITIASGNNEKNVEVALPDGSRIFLNRNSEFRYRSNFGDRNRNVTLTGEAYFEIAPDGAMPFIIDAGNARVKVVGTSFNVITNNIRSEVEVFVKTGKVLLSNNSGSKSMALEPGYVGTIDDEITGKELNKNPNYLSWKTGLLVYNGQKLDIVFSDLKRVYNMDIEAADPSILENRWTSPIDNQPQETIIRLICASFNLSYTKEGNIYRLVKK
jgi:transmembrane sensor